MKKALCSLLFSVLVLTSQAQTTQFTLPALLAYHGRTIDQTSRQLLSQGWELASEDADPSQQSNKRLLTRGDEQGVMLEWYAVADRPFQIDYVDRRGGGGNAVFYLDALKWLGSNGYTTKRTVKEQSSADGVEALKTVYEKGSGNVFSYIEISRLMRASDIIGYKYSSFRIELPTGDN